MSTHNSAGYGGRGDLMIDEEQAVNLHEALTHLEAATELVDDAMPDTEAGGFKAVVDGLRERIAGWLEEEE